MVQRWHLLQSLSDNTAVGIRSRPGWVRLGVSEVDRGVLLSDNAAVGVRSRPGGVCLGVGELGLRLGGGVRNEGEGGRSHYSDRLIVS